MRYTQDITASLAKEPGAQEPGDGRLAPAAFDALLTEAEAACGWLRDACADGRLPALTVSRTSDDLPLLQEVAARLRATCDTVAVFGTGGSSLGAQAVCALGMDPDAPRLHFFDNIDPATFDTFWRTTDPARLGLIIVSKSGGTAETLAQALIAIPKLADAVGRDGLAERVVAISESGDNALRCLAAHWGITVLDHDPGVGGRYAVFTLVGVLPALLGGRDAAALRAGAAETLKQALAPGPARDIPAAAGAALAVGLARDCTIGTIVLMPYCDNLRLFTLWYRQLWAESLGKNGQGTNPVAALGAVDQHSQLQLYLEGPADKAYTVIALPHEGRGEPIDADLARSIGAGYLAGQTIGDLMGAEQNATINTLVANNRPVRVISVAQLDDAALGALMMHYMLETIIAARLMGVDAFDQPAVEDGKRRARATLEGRG